MDPLTVASPPYGTLRWPRRLLNAALQLQFVSPGRRIVFSVDSTRLLLCHAGLLHSHCIAAGLVSDEEGQRKCRREENHMQSKEHKAEAGMWMWLFMQG